jgi:hypothetical protein
LSGGNDLVGCRMQKACQRRYFVHGKLTLSRDALRKHRIGNSDLFGEIALPEPAASNE